MGGVSYTLLGWTPQSFTIFAEHLNGASRSVLPSQNGSTTPLTTQSVRYVSKSATQFLPLDLLDRNLSRVRLQLFLLDNPHSAPAVSEQRRPAARN